MIGTILDTETGEQVTFRGMVANALAGGNWSCDCNRALLFDADGGVPLHASCQSRCLGCRRFIISENIPDSEEENGYTLAELNAGYPSELLAAHGIGINPTGD